MIFGTKKLLDAISSVQMDPDPGEQGVLSEHLAGIMAPMTAAVVVTRVWLVWLRIGLRLSSS